MPLPPNLCHQSLQSSASPPPSSLSLCRRCVGDGVTISRDAAISWWLMASDRKDFLWGGHGAVCQREEVAACTQLLLIRHYVCFPASPWSHPFCRARSLLIGLPLIAWLSLAKMFLPPNKLLQRKRDIGHQWRTSQDRYLQHLHNVRYADLLPLYLTW